MAGSQLLYSEILELVHKAKTKKEKVRLLKYHNSEGLRSQQVRKLFRFIEGGDNQTPQFKKEQMFIQMLEGLHESEAELLVNAKDKKLHQVYKGLSTNVVQEAFDWDDNFMIIGDRYVPATRSATGTVDE